MSSTNTMSSPLSNPAADEVPAADPFLALLTDCETAAATLLTTLSLRLSVPSLTSLATELGARSIDSVQRAVREVSSSRAALFARKTRALGCAKRLSRKQCKRADAELEAADVANEQLRVWAAVAAARAARLNHDWLLACTSSAVPLLAPSLPFRAPGALLSFSPTISFTGELGSVITGDELRVVSAAGPGLKWFESHSRNEFSVVLAHADSSTPVWLTTGDVAVAVMSIDTTGAPARLTHAAQSDDASTVRLVYDVVPDDEAEVVLQLVVCGVVVADAAGHGEWRVCVPRRPLAGHSCAAVGTHVCTLAVTATLKYGMAVSADEKLLVVGDDDGGIIVYSLPGGERVPSLSSSGRRRRHTGPMQLLEGQRRMCFAPNGHLLVVDRSHKRLLEVALNVFVRFICQGMFGDSDPFCVAAHDEVIAVGCIGGTGPRVVLFRFGTGVVMLRFGEVGVAPGQLCRGCTSIRFTPDGSCLMITEGLSPYRLSVFTTAGVFVQCVGVDVLGGGAMDVVQSVTGEFCVADNRNHRVCVFTPDGSELVRSWGGWGVCDGQFRYPCTLAIAGQHLYVMEKESGRVQMFE